MRAVKLPKRQALQIVMDAMLVCWGLSLAFKAGWLFWTSSIAAVLSAAVVVCWGSVIRKHKNNRR